MIWKRRRECGAFFFGEWGELDERSFVGEFCELGE